MTSLEIEAWPQGEGKYRLRTNGLKRRGRAEIEIDEVSEAQVEEAARLVKKVADEVTQRPAQPRYTLALDDSESLVVRLVETEHEPAGVFGRLLGASDRVVMKMVDAHGHRGIDVALSTLARQRANALVEAGRAEEAQRILEDSITLFPGSPSPGPQPLSNPEYNWQNALAYLDLAGIVRDERRAFDFYYEGLMRSESAQTRELGATFADIFGIEPRKIIEDMQRIAAINLGLVGRTEDRGANVRVVPSPVWQPRREDGVLRAQLGMTVLPARCLSLYWTGPIRRELETGQIPALAADIFMILARRTDGIARLGFVSRETRQTFPVPEDAPRAYAAPEAVRPHVFLASAVLAHVARMRVARLDRNEMLVHFGVREDPRLVTGIKEKRRALRVKQAIWLGENVI